MMRTPSFWYRSGISLKAVALLPLAAIWLLAGKLRYLVARPYRSSLKVVCVGNVTTGGTGKTPLTAALAEAATNRGWTPVILTRGHGGSTHGPVLVKPGMTAAQTGDEPLMLAQHCPVVIARDRGIGARWIEDHTSADLIIMDDGLQNPTLHKDASIAVFSGRLGIGNGLPVPAGPMRERLSRGLRHCDAAVITGDDLCGVESLLARCCPGLRVHHARRQLDKSDLATIGQAPVVAFAGIGDPDGFFTMLEDAGVALAGRLPLADHAEIEAPFLAEANAMAKAAGARLVTTEKDMARLGGATQGIVAIRLQTHLDPGILDKIIPRR